MMDVNLWSLLIPIGASIVVAGGGYFISMSRMIGIVEGRQAGGKDGTPVHGVTAAATAAATAATTAATAASTAATAASTAASVYLEALKRIESSVAGVDKKVELVMENFDKLCVQKHKSVDKEIENLEARMIRQEGK